MRALLLNQERRISLQSINVPRRVRNGEALIKVHFSPINPSDLGFSQNVYGRFGHRSYPMGLGFEGSGEIKESEDKSLIGKKVCFLLNYEKENFIGAWSDYTIANKNEYLVLPDHLNDMKKAAYLFINPLTSLSFIEIMKRSNCDSVIHTAGASAVGRMFTRLCARNNFKIINTVRKEKQIEELALLGSHSTLLTTQENFRESLKDITRAVKPKIAFECVGGEMTGTVLNALQEGATLYHYGNLSLRNCSGISSADLIFLDKSIKGYWLFNYLNHAKDSNILPTLFEYLSTDLFDTNIQGVFKPDQFESALKLYRSGMSQGKVLLDFN